MTKTDLSIENGIRSIVREELRSLFNFQTRNDAKPQELNMFAPTTKMPRKRRRRRVAASKAPIKGRVIKATDGRLKANRA